MQCLTCDLPDCHLAHCVKVGGDGFFPGIHFVPRLLLRHDVLELEVLVRPPAHAFAVTNGSLGKELIAVPSQGIDINGTDFHWPETPSASFVTQIRAPVGCADENALARFDDLLSAVA